MDLMGFDVRFDENHVYMQCLHRKWIPDAEVTELEQLEILSTSTTSNVTE